MLQIQAPKHCAQKENEKKHAIAFGCSSCSARIKAAKGSPASGGREKGGRGRVWKSNEKHMELLILLCFVCNPCFSNMCDLEGVVDEEDM